jgi:UDP-glucose 4-epimerase
MGSTNQEWCSKGVPSMNSSYEKVCVTGAAGFVGSHLVDRLLLEQFDVTAIDNLSSGTLENIKHNFGIKKFRFANCDILDFKSIRSLVRGVEVIFHEAALTNVQTSIRDPYLTNSINVVGTLNLLRAALESGVKLFVYASSAAVYGDVTPPQAEDTPTNPISPYGFSKLMAEKYVNMFGSLYGLGTICLRYFNIYGIRQNVESSYSGVVTKLIKRLLENKPLIVYGNGQQSRDFISVQDVVAANMLAIESRNAVGQIFNIGTARGVSINELASLIFEHANDFSGGVKHTKARRGDILHSRADITKAARILGFSPRNQVEKELPKLIEWYKTPKPITNKERQTSKRALDEAM